MRKREGKGKKQAEKKNAQNLFKFTREDFGELPVNVLHMDLHFDVYATETKVLSHFRAKSLKRPLRQLTLNAKNLEVALVTCNKGAIDWEYDKKKSLLVIRFGRPIPPRTEFIITTQNSTRPTKNILEGLYYDETPPGCPPTQITQCQQWGFQRLVPCIDEMTAKCTYTTTITADERYTNIITNGDIAEPRKSIGKGRVRIRYSNTVTPMAPYLFFLGVGTYSTFTKELEYPDGKTFMLELLVPPKSDKVITEKALQVLHDAILWIHLFTGPDKYKNEMKSREILSLIELRERMKQAGKDPAELRKRIKALAAPLRLGYRYTGTVYREIGMQNSDFGGMENVGNTTITTNRIMPFPEMTDGAFEYMIRVKAHEFYHNLNGSEVTGQSPFEIWLNEAVTVHVEKEYHSFVFGETYSRLQEVMGMFSPDRGTFMEDESAGSMPVEPDGFNDPNELITSITYVKAPEFVRMIELTLGKELFVKGLDLYHRTYRHSNATRAQWIQCMEEVSGLNLKHMAQVWLKTVGFPHVNLTGTYNTKKGEYVITAKQTNATKKVWWEFPFTAAVVDASGNDLAEVTTYIAKPGQSIVLKDVLREPAFISLNRTYSFYGKINQPCTRQQLMLQVRRDNDIISRFMAFYRLLDAEKMKLLKDPQQAIDKEIISLYYELLSDDRLIQDAGAQFLALFESVEDGQYAHRYQELYDVRKKIQKAIAAAYKTELLQLYRLHNRESHDMNYLRKQAADIKERQVKNLCLALLSSLDTPDIHALIRQQFDSATNATDKVMAFRLYMNSAAKDKLEVLEAYEQVAKKNLVSWETFLAVIGGNDSKDALVIIKRIEKSSSFRAEQTNDQRALYGTFANNRKRSLQTEEGRNFLKERLIRLARINEYTTVRLLGVFGNIELMEAKYHAPLVKTLMEVMRSLDQDKMPSVCNTIRRMFTGMPKAVKAYGKKKR